MKIFFLAFSILIFIVMGSFLFTAFIRPIGTFEEDEFFVVGEEMSESEIYEKLTQKGFINYPLTLKIARFIAQEKDPILPGGYKLHRTANAFEITKSLKDPERVFVTLSPNMTKRDIAKRVSEALNWDEEKKAKFVTAYSSIQWDTLNNKLIPLFADRFSWGSAEQKAFSTMGAFFSDEEYDFMENYYVPKDYLLSKDLSRAQVASVFVSDFMSENDVFLRRKLVENLDSVRANNVYELVRGEVELLPDLIPLPPEDITFTSEGGQRTLSFSTTYSNEGRGTFELIADAKTKWVSGDVNRDVYQRIYRVDGEFRDDLVGNFLWHDEHLHYHLDNFIEYNLERYENGEIIDKNSFTKATYCIRDVDFVNLTVSDAYASPTYRICGKERQGLSVGWGDSYYFTYADQSFDITDLESGTYRLRFNVNPKNLVEELSYENNESYAIIFINKEAEKVQIVELYGG